MKNSSFPRSRLIKNKRTNKKKKTTILGNKFKSCLMRSNTSKNWESASSTKSIRWKKRLPNSKPKFRLLRSKSQLSLSLSLSSLKKSLRTRLNRRDLLKRRENRTKSKLLLILVTNTRRKRLSLPKKNLLKESRLPLQKEWELKRKSN